MQQNKILVLAQTQYKTWQGFSTCIKIMEDVVIKYV